MVWKAKKVFIDYNHPLTIEGIPQLLKTPRYELYYQKSFCFGLFKKWVFRMTMSIDPKVFLTIKESNYDETQ